MDVVTAGFRPDSGDSCLTFACPDAIVGFRPAGGIPRRLAMSRAREGEESRTELPIRVEASADVVGLGFDFATFASSTFEGCGGSLEPTDSGVGEFSGASRDLMIRASR